MKVFVQETQEHWNVKGDRALVEVKPDDQIAPTRLALPEHVKRGMLIRGRRDECYIATVLAIGDGYLETDGKRYYCGEQKEPVSPYHCGDKVLVPYLMAGHPVDDDACKNLYFIGLNAIVAKVDE
jgi:hypothetical protein